MATRTPRTDVCPYLGRGRDRPTYLGYPSPGNHCHRIEPPEKVALAHQARYCLADKHKKCPVFSDKWSGPLPDELRLSKRRIRRLRP